MLAKRHLRMSRLVPARNDTPASAKATAVAAATTVATTTTTTSYSYAAPAPATATAPAAANAPTAAVTAACFFYLRLRLRFLHARSSRCSEPTVRICDLSELVFLYGADSGWGHVIPRSGHEAS